MQIRKKTTTRLAAEDSRFSPGPGVIILGGSLHGGEPRGPVVDLWEI